MPKFLLDANLSPKIGRFLFTQLGLDVISLLSLALGEISDQDVLRLARSLDRVVITLDRDFTQPHAATGSVAQGIIYLNLPNNRRYVPHIQQILGEFLRNQADSIDLEHTLVILSEDQIETRQ